MKLSNSQYEAIKTYLTIQRGNVIISNKLFLETLLLVIKTGMQWRELNEEKYGKWNSIYKKANRWAKKGTLQDVFLELQKKQGIIKVGIISIDSTSVKVHQDTTGALKKMVNNVSAQVMEERTSKIHMVASNFRTSLITCLSPGNVHDGKYSIKLIEKLNDVSASHLVMDRAYEGDNIRRSIK